MITPGLEDQVYFCPRCGGTFVRSGLHCSVIHPPGTCCHYGEQQLSGEDRKKRFWAFINRLNTSNWKK